MANESAIFLSASPAPASQVRLVAVIAVALFLAFLLALPFRNMLVPQQTAFIPIVDTVLSICDFTTAVLLYAQFSVVRSRALLALATGYLFTALIIVPHLLTFPGVFVAPGLLGAGLQSTVWLYIFWHLGMPLAVVAYAVMKGAKGIQSSTHGFDRLGVLSSVTFAALAAVALTVLATRFEPVLPQIMISVTQANSVWEVVTAPVLIGLSILAMTLLWRRRYSVLDLWLLLVVWAWFLETVLLSMTSVRYSVVWYEGRVFGILASSFVLLALLYESTLLYARLALSVLAKEREREHQQLTLEVIIGSISHELNQPLTSILANGETGILLINRLPADTLQVSEVLGDIVNDVNRASDIIKSIRDAVAGANQPMATVDLGRIVRESLMLLRSELRVHDIVVEHQAAPQMLLVRGNKGQLLQVLVNLITNALESMREVTTRPRLLRIRSGMPRPSQISISVEDAGVGVQPELVSRIFDPLFTTKVQGTGLGLAICQSIVLAHGGRITMTRGERWGSIFEISLPAHVQAPTQ